MHTTLADAAIFTPRPRRPLMRQITDHLRRRIVSGELRVGRQLPSVRKLARLYGVSIPTMQGALHALASVGFIRITHGVGTFVTRPSSDSTVLVYAWREATPLELAAMRETIDGRMPILAARAVRLMSGGRLPRPMEDLAFLAAERSARRQGGVPAESFVRADLEFHRAIVSAARGTEISSSLYDEIGRRLLPHLRAGAGRQAADLGLDQAHRALATAVTAGAIRAAARLASTIARRESESVERALGAG